jgi:hypothetical protein
MTRPVAHITAPWPTQEEVEKLYPISKVRKRALQSIVDEFKAKLSNREEVLPVTSETEKRRKRASAAYDMGVMIEE